MSIRKRVAAGFNFHFKGTNELVARLKDAQNLDLVKETLAMNGAELQEKAMRNAPVDTGHLKRSITLSSDLASRGLVVRVQSTADYSPYVEFGTRFKHAQPYMRPAYLKQKTQFIEDMKRIVK